MSDIKIVANGNKIIVKPDDAGITITPNAVKIIVSAGGPQGIPGSGSVWGGIGGTLSNQTDLQAALDGKATSAQGTLADSATQPSDNVSTLTNDAGYITSAALPSDTDDLPEGSINLYYTESRVTDNTSVTTNTSKISYTDAAAVSLNTAKVTNANHTGDATGATVLTLATVNSNVGSFINADVTVDAKGRITAVSDGASGAGDMTKAVYDPQTVEADAFARGNHTGTITASVVSDFDVEVANNTAVTLNTAKLTNVTTNLTTSQTSTTIDVISSDGTNVTLPQAIAGGNAGVMSGADKALISDNKEHIDQFSSTGLIVGCDIFINVGGTSVDINSGEGEVFDNYTDPLNPVHTHNTFSGVTGLTLTNIGTTIVTFLGLKDSTGTVFQQSTQFTSAQRREFWWTGFATHLDLATVGSVGLGVNSVTDQNNSLRDLWSSLGIVTTDCSFSANGTNLNINRSAGLKSFTDINYETDRQDPNNKTMASGTALSFSTMYQNGSGGFTTITDQTVVDVGNFDDGSGTLSSMSPNKFQVKRIYFFSNGFTTLTYGQIVYNSFEAAVAGIQTEIPSTNPLLLDQDLRCFLVCKSNGSDLSDTGEAIFSNTPKFGNVGSGGSGSSGSAQDLQATYNLSVNPEILTDSTRGAITLKQGSGSDTDNIYEGQNGAGSVTFSVDGAGNVTAKNISSWNFYALNVEYTGVEITIASGTVLTCTIDAVTIFRFINSTNNVNGYPIEDSFYADFTDPTLSNLLATRG